MKNAILIGLIALAAGCAGINQPARGDGASLRRQAYLVNAAAQTRTPVVVGLSDAPESGLRTDPDGPYFLGP